MAERDQHFHYNYSALDDMKGESLQNAYSHIKAINSYLLAFR